VIRSLKEGNAFGAYIAMIEDPSWETKAIQAHSLPVIRGDQCKARFFICF